MPNHCEDHEQMRQDVTETLTNVKWLVSERKRTNGSVEKHIAESDKVRSSVKTNSAFRVAFIWTLGVFGAIVIFLIKNVIN